MEIRRIKTEEDLERVSQRIYDLIQLQPEPDSEAHEELELLSILAAEYEEKHYPVPPPHPLEAIRFQLEQMGLEESELGEILGLRQRKSDILSGRRKLSLSMIRKLHEKLHIPAEILIRAY